MTNNNNSQKGFAIPMIIAIIALVVVVGGIGYFATRTKPSPTANTQTPAGEKTLPDGTVVKVDGTMVKPDGTMEKKEEGAPVPSGVEGMMEKGSYEAYALEKLALANKGDVVLFFRASWCPTCRGLDADIKAHLKNIPAGLTILDVYYDASIALKQKYGVTYQHTLVQVDASGKQIAKWTGSPTLAALVSNVK